MFIQKLSLLLSFSFLLSCSTETFERNELEQINYNELNLKVDEYLNQYAPYFENQATIMKTYERFSSNAQKSSREPIMTIYVDLTSEKVEYTKDDLADIYTDAQKTFLLAYFNEVANAKGSDLLDIIAKHKLFLENTVLTNEEYEHILFLLESSEKTITLIEESLFGTSTTRKGNNISNKRDCFWNCMAGEGSNISRGMVTGLIGGAIWGANVGGGGGAVALPFVGAVPGAVAGTILGAAGGAVTGAFGAALWSTADCLIRCEQNTNEHAECTLDDAGFEVCPSTTV